MNAEGTYWVFRRGICKGGHGSSAERDACEQAASLAWEALTDQDRQPYLRTFLDLGEVSGAALP
jgi:hypothetical protein